MGQFACLLPTLVVVAVSQAPSPESNPDSPLPVTATVVQYTTVKLIGQKLLRSRRDGQPPRGKPPRNLPTLRPRRASLSQPWQHTGLVYGRWSLYQLGVHPPPLVDRDHTRRSWWSSKVLHGWLLRTCISHKVMVDVQRVHCGWPSTLYRGDDCWC